MSVHIRKNGTVIVRFRENGKQRHKKFGSGKQAIIDAKAYDRAIKEKKKQAKAALGYTVTKEVTYLDELAGLYFKADETGAKKKWILDWIKMMNRHILPELSRIPIAQLTQEGLVDFIMKKFPKACASTHGNYLSYLKIMFNWGIERGYIEKNPLQFWKKKSTPQKDFSLTKEDIMKIRDAAPAHTALAIEIVANTGVRPGPSELLRLRWINIDWNNSYLRVFAGKTQKWRTIPLKPELLNKLRAQKEKAKSDFIIEFNGRGVSSVHKSFRTACRKEGVGDEVVLYDIRHWFCTSLLSRGVPVKTVSMLMGHSSAKMTLDKYAHIIPGDTEKAIAELPDLK